MLVDVLKEYKVFLASKSPRRRELLAGMGVDFEIISTEVEERFNAEDAPQDIVMGLSRLKMSPIRLGDYPEKTVFITCDTIVVVDGQVVGKPKDRAEAVRMLRTLSGNRHTVYSGLTVATPKKQITDFRTTDVVFETLSDEMIEYYIDKYLPYDKAGSYGVQEWIGYVGIREVHGSFYNVMGLPTRLLWQMLEEVCREW
ncbi:MAG: Maf family protein [Bacteroidales bacterium]|nr:Maf family protein [Bacteroidales bacterium]MDY6346991.1 Maf family protein [Bacteroidales bacterium]